jgi:hypothetical protein
MMKIRLIAIVKPDQAVVNQRKKAVTQSQTKHAMVSVTWHVYCNAIMDKLRQIIHTWERINPVTQRREVK